MDLQKRCNYYFYEISKIPRGTKNEKAISNYIVEFAKTHHLKYVQEDCFNVIVYKEASKGYEDHDFLLLQGHMDIVCEKNRDCEHDFLKDPLDLYIEDGMLKAKGTTLGADDGVAVAYMLAILEDTSLTHPPLECLFTVGEEEGMDGAFGLDPSHIQSTRMIGLDNTQEGYSYVCSAGGVDVFVEKEMNRISNCLNTYLISITGLLGGHSAVCIQLGRANANKLMSRILHTFKQQNISVYLVDLEGGMKFNAIPRECFMSFSSDAPFSKLNEIIKKLEKDFMEEYKTTDVIHIQIEQIPQASSCFDLESSNEFISLFYLLKNGCIERMQNMNMPSLSLNMGVVKTQENAISIRYLVRSPLKSNRFELANEIEELCHILHANCTISGDYDGWNYDPNSKIRSQLKKYYLKKTRKEYKEEAVHGGLEIGIFKGKIPSLDAVTFGPNIYDYHTPNERLDVSSFERCYEMLKEFIEEL